MNKFIYERSEINQINESKKDRTRGPGQRVFEKDEQGEQPEVLILLSTNIKSLALRI